MQQNKKGMNGVLDFIQPRDAWDKLSMREKAEMMKVAVRNGIYNLNDIREKYNEFAKGGNKKKEEEVSIDDYSVGNLVDALYLTNPREEYLGEPSHHYNFTQSEEWANAHGYYPDARGHRDDRVKKPAHPSHPSRGTWNKDKFVLTDLGMQNPNYTMFGLVDGGQDPQATLIYKDGVVLPEITVTPQGNYFFNPYDNIELHTKAHGGGIHIKHPGRLTALKKRTGKTEAELYNDGNPAHKKMVVFARNSRKWKHSDGGNLFYPGGNTKASDYRYVLDDDGEWHRIANDEMGRVFQGLTITPRKIKQKFIPERIDNSLETAKAREKFFQYRDEEGHIKGEPGLEIVSPEFEVLMGARMAMPTYSQEATRNYKIAKSFKADTKRMPSVNSAFRNEEWSNFLSTRNGDNYYRLVDKSREAYSPKEKYFVSHTTPWEEFSGLGTRETIGTDKLYEFPTEIFGKLRSSTSRGLPTEFDVTEMGRKHLLYGNTSSGIRGPVRVLSDKNAATIGESPFKIGVTERPTLENGFYDSFPVYEELGMGNQTVLKGSTLERNINDATYNIFERTPFGILKTLHIGK